MPTVAITGATGFVGWHVCEAFHDAGWRVRALVRPGSRKPLPAGIDVLEAVLQADSLARVLDGCDALVHAAGLVRARTRSRLFLTNVGGTRAAVEAAGAAGVRLVYVSSQAAIGTGTVARPAREDDPPRPLTAYGQSKAAAEEVVRSAARGAWVILRPTSVYGPRDRQFLPLFKLASLGVFAQVADPGKRYSLIHVADLARAVVLAASEDRAVGETMFVGHADPSSAGDLFRVLARSFDRTFRPLPIPRAVATAVALAGEAWWLLGRPPVLDLARLAELRAEGFVCSVDRAREVLGFSASTPLGEGIRQTARWYERSGWI